MSISLTILPARDGDCLLLRCEVDDGPKHIVVDLGRSATWRETKRVLSDLEDVSLLAITHVDEDHIAGAVAMFNDDDLRFSPADVWFNSWLELNRAVSRSGFESLSPRQGEKVTEGIRRLGWPHNGAFDQSGIVSTHSPEAKDWIELSRGIRILLLSPDDGGLRNMLEAWNRALAEAGLRPNDADEREIREFPGFESLGMRPDVEALAHKPYNPDPAPSNGSSIAFVVEVGGKRVLLAADANSETMESSLRPWAEKEGGKFRIDLVKISHHGARSNTSPSFLELVDCQRFVFSTDGSRGHEHPHPETIARILTADPGRPKTLYFNYRSSHTLLWDNISLASKWNYTAVYCEQIEDGWLEIQV